VLEDSKELFWLRPTEVKKIWGGVRGQINWEPTKGGDGGGAARRKTREGAEVGEPARLERRGSVPGLGRSFSLLSLWLYACESIVKHFLPLGHGVPPSFSMEEPLSFFLGTWG
jgi:hypothetical protein